MGVTEAERDTLSDNHCATDAVAEARDMLRSGQYDTAYKQLTTVLAEEEEEAGRLEATILRCAAALKLGRTRRAVLDGKAAVALAPSDARAYIALGNARMASGDLKMAKRCFKSAVALEPSNAVFRDCLALARDAIKERSWKRWKTFFLALGAAVLVFAFGFIGVVAVVACFAQAEEEKVAKKAYR